MFPRQYRLALYSLICGDSWYISEGWQSLAVATHAEYPQSVWTVLISLANAENLYRPSRFKCKIVLEPRREAPHQLHNGDSRIIVSLASLHTSCNNEGNNKITWSMRSYRCCTESDQSGWLYCGYGARLRTAATELSRTQFVYTRECTRLQPNDPERNPAALGYDQYSFRIRLELLSIIACNRQFELRSCKTDNNCINKLRGTPDSFIPLASLVSSECHNRRHT